MDLDIRKGLLAPLVICAVPLLGGCTLDRVYVDHRPNRPGYQQRDRRPIPRREYQHRERRPRWDGEHRPRGDGNRRPWRYQGQRR